MIGMLFIILAADVRLSDVQNLGLNGIVVVLFLILVVRPISVFIGTNRSTLDTPHKLLLSWIVPRGIVAAAIASLFVFELDRHGFDGTQLRALVFLLIIITVSSAGLTGGWVASVLDLKRKSQSGWIILGAHEVARTLSRLLKQSGNEIICIDEDPQSCLLAKNEGIKVFFGNALEERTLQRAEPDSRKGIIALSGNEEVNYIFSQRAKHLSKEMDVLIGIKDSFEGITPEMINETGGKIPFGRSADMDFWSSLIRQKKTTYSSYTYIGGGKFDLSDESLEPVDSTTKIKNGDLLTFLINEQKRVRAEKWLIENSFQSADI